MNEEMQTATQDMRCGSCGDTVAEGDEYYWHGTGTVECVACHEANEAHEQ